MYVHIGDTISVPIESIITMVHAKGGKSHKSPIHHYEMLEYIAMFCYFISIKCSMIDC